jgi:predicted nucleotidyltransferase
MVGQELNKGGKKLEIVLLGDAAMLIEVGNRDSTYDVDTFFVSDFTALVKASAVVAAQEKLPDGWLNSAAAGFTYNFKKQPDKHLWKSFPGLDVYIVSLDYLFVTKVMAGRQKDREDIKVLAAKLSIVTRQEVMNLVTQYVAHEDISKDVLRQVAYLFDA